jgi:hypothetical protein
MHADMSPLVHTSSWRGTSLLLSSSSATRRPTKLSSRNVNVDDDLHTSFITKNAS